MSRSKKICQILAGDEEGGLEKHFVELCNRIAEENTVHVIAHRKYGDRFNNNVIFHPLDLSRGRSNPVILYRLGNLIRNIQPDIVHAHANKAVAMVAAVKPFLPRAIKTVATLHSTKRKLARFEKFDHVIGVSHEVLKKLRTPNKSVVYNGIGLVSKEKDPQFFSTSFGINNEFVVCAVGRLEPVKNFPMLIRATRDLDIILLIVGEGGQEKKLKELVKTLSIENKVIFTGYRNDVADVLVNSDLCVITSEKEGFPYILVEALLEETPVISTDVSDIKQILPPEFVIPINDVKSLRDILLRTINNYQDVVRCFQDSFRFAKENFTLEKMVENTLQVYEKVLTS